MYPYHNRIKQRIRNGELIGYEFRTDYPGIGECLVFQFNTVPIFRPVRPHRYVDYVGILADWNKKKNPARCWRTERERRTEPPRTVLALVF